LQAEGGAVVVGRNEAGDRANYREYTTIRAFKPFGLRY